MRKPIWPKFETCIGGLKVNTRINLRVNLINIQEVLSDFINKAKSNFCHTYRVNSFEELAENQYVARLNIRTMPFGGYKID